MTSTIATCSSILGKVVQGLFHKAGAYPDRIAICPRVDNWSKMHRFSEYCDLKFHDPEVLLLIDEIMRRYRMGKDINIGAI
jgi:hypothetical protein